MFNIMFSATVCPYRFYFSDLKLHDVHIRSLFWYVHLRSRYPYSLLHKQMHSNVSHIYIWNGTAMTNTWNNAIMRIKTKTNALNASSARFIEPFG